MSLRPHFIGCFNIILFIGIKVKFSYRIINIWLKIGSISVYIMKVSAEGAIRANRDFDFVQIRNLTANIIRCP